MGRTSKEKKVASASQKVAGRQKGSINYKPACLMRLATIARAIKPQGQMHWEKVCEVFNLARPEDIPARDADSLRERFKKMCKEKKPTGDPLCPAWIRLAKRAHRAILEEANVLEADDAGQLVLSPEELADRAHEAAANAAVAHLTMDREGEGAEDEDEDEDEFEDHDGEMSERQLFGVDDDGGDQGGLTFCDAEPKKQEVENGEDMGPSSVRRKADKLPDLDEDRAILRLPGTESGDENVASKEGGQEQRPPRKPAGKPKNPPQRLGTTDPKGHIVMVKDRRRRLSATSTLDGDSDSDLSIYSETKRRKLKLDKLVDKLSEGAGTEGKELGGSQQYGFWEQFLAQQARSDQEWRREQARRDDERRQEELRRDEDRRADRQMMMMMMMMMRLAGQSQQGKWAPSAAQDLASPIGVHGAAPASQGTWVELGAVPRASAGVPPAVAVQSAAQPFGAAPRAPPPHNVDPTPPFPFNPSM